MIRPHPRSTHFPHTTLFRSVTWIRPTNGASFPAGSLIQLTARATDSDGTVSYVDFYANSNNLGRVTVASSNSVYNFAWTSAPAGTFRLHAESTDNDVGRGLSDAAQIAGTNGRG